MIPSAAVLLGLALSRVRGLRPDHYQKLEDYLRGIIWHFLQPSNVKGYELVKNIKDLVRGTIYT